MQLPAMADLRWVGRSPIIDVRCTSPKRHSHDKGDGRLKWLERPDVAASFFNNWQSIGVGAGAEASGAGCVRDAKVLRADGCWGVSLSLSAHTTLVRLMLTGVGRGCSTSRPGVWDGGVK